jgi:hypothetical protein
MNVEVAVPSTLARANSAIVRSTSSGCTRSRNARPTSSSGLQPRMCNHAALTRRNVPSVLKTANMSLDSEK